MKINDMYIVLKGLKFYAYHGVAEQETVVGNTFLIDLTIRTNFAHAAETDELEDTISYADLFNTIKEEMEVSSKLLEHVAGRIARRLFADFPNILSLELKLAKQNPPMGADIDTAGVILNCER